MKKRHSGHALPIIIILIVSLAFGGIFELLCLGGERLMHPRRYDDIVAKYAAEYSVPEAVIYTMLKTESDFDSTKHGENGEIGLLQLTPALYVRLATQAHDAEMNAAALYDPDTNIRYGTMYLSLLYTKYGMWSTVYAAWYAGEDAVDTWLANPNYVDPDFSTLQTVPDKKVAKAVKKAVKAHAIYEKLYYAK